MSRRVVVTGLGTVNPLGLDVETFWKAAQEGKSGIGEITHFDASHMKARIAGEIDDFDPEVYIERKEARRLDRYDQLFWASTHQALADSGISYEEDDPEAMRAGVSVGSGIGGMISFQNGIDTMRERGPDRVSPLTTVTGILITNAHGQAIIKIARPLYSHPGVSSAVSSNGSPKANTGIATTRTASTTTAGVYQRANRSINRSAGLRCA